MIEIYTNPCVAAFNNNGEVLIFDTYRKSMKILKHWAGKITSRDWRGFRNIDEATFAVQTIRPITKTLWAMCSNSAMVLLSIGKKCADAQDFVPHINGTQLSIAVINRRAYAIRKSYYDSSLRVSQVHPVSDKISAFADGDDVFEDIQDVMVYTGTNEFVLFNRSFVTSEDKFMPLIRLRRFNIGEDLEINQVAKLDIPVHWMTRCELPVGFDDRSLLLSITNSDIELNKHKNHLLDIVTGEILAIESPYRHTKINFTDGRDGMFAFTATYVAEKNGTYMPLIGFRMNDQVHWIETKQNYHHVSISPDKMTIIYSGGHGAIAIDTW